VYTKLTNGADFAQVAKEQSEDQGSTLQRRKILGWVYAWHYGGLEFEDVMNKNQPSEVSANLFRTQFWVGIFWQVEGRSRKRISVIK